MKCVEVYKELYHQEPFDVAFCPYRISPLGAHIDHQYGKINGLAIDKGIHMAYHPKQNGVVELQSLNFPKRAQFFVNAVPDEKQGDWADHLRGAAKMLGEKYRLKVGLSGIIEGSLPIGGLSSSASVIICFLSALCKVNSIGEYLNSSFHAFTWTTDYVKDMEPLFPLLVLIVTKITGSLYCVQTILELCVILPLYVAVRKDKNTSLGMAMFVFCMAFYNPSMNMMRQSIAMSLGVLGFEYWKNAEKKNSFICVIIAFLFHTSSLLILLIYLLYDYIVKGTTLSITGNNVSKRNETPRMLISMGIGFVVMIMMSAIVSALSAVGFGEYVSYVTGKLVFMPNQLLIRIPQIILIIWSYRYLRKDGEDISFFLVMEVYAVLFSQFTSVSGYGGRIALYFAIFEVLVISQAMSALKPRKSGIIIRPLIIGYYMFYWWYYFVFVGAHQTVPYIFMR